jgi:membrane-associated phospholipid phosphatase
VPVVSYSVASLVGLSRIYDNKHWITDVVAGAAIGTLVGNMVCRRVPNSRLAWMPMFDQHIQGIHLAYRL